MSRKLCMISGRWLGVLALLWLVCSAVRADDPAAEEGGARQRWIQRQADALGSVPFSAFIASAQPGSHWLGLECAPLGDALRSHLKLPQGQGLLIVHIVPESPAEKKLQPHDVLVSAGGEPLNDIGKLVDAIQNSKDAELELKLIRGGKPIKVSVRPAERPKNRAPAQEAQRRLHMIPGGMSVTIKKDGDNPAKITVQRGDQKWEVTEEELDELPEDIRIHIQQLRKYGASDHEGARRIITVPRIQTQQLPALRPIVPPNFPHGEADRRMDEMLQRIERLERALEEKLGPPEDAAEKKRRKPSDSLE